MELNNTIVNTTKITNAEMPSIPINITNAVIGSSITVLTLSGQVLVFIIISKDSRLQTPNNYYVISLTLADLLLSILSMPVWTIFTTLNYWPFSQLLCDLWNSLDHALCLISIHTIVFISIERYRSVSNPIKHKVFLTARRMRTCLICIWFTDFTIWTSYVFITQYFYAKIRDPQDCGVSYLTEPILAISFGTLIVTFPVLVTAIVYILIFRIAQRAGVIKGTTGDRTSLSNINSKTVTPFHDTSDSASECTVSTVTGNLYPDSVNKEQGTMKSTKKGAKEDKEKKALKTIALLLVTFAICWLPLGGVFIIEGIAPGYLDIAWLVAGYWLGYANSMLNPICYAVGNPYFRENLSKCLSKNNM